MVKRGIAGGGGNREKLQWLQRQVRQRAYGFTPTEKAFVEDLQVDQVGDVFGTTKSTPSFRTILGHKLSLLPPFRKERFDRIGISKKNKAKNVAATTYFDLTWTSASAPLPRDPPVYVKPQHNYDEVIELIRRKGWKVKTALLIQHHGQASERLREYLVSRHPGCKVKLYLQNPERACCPNQTDKLDVYLDDLRKNARMVMTHCHPKRVEVFQCDSPCGIRAVLIDNHALAIGWYIHYPDTKRKLPANAQGQYPTDRHGNMIDIMGLNLPTLYATREWSDFPILRRVIKWWEDNVGPSAHQVVL